MVDADHKCQELNDRAVRVQKIVTDLAEFYISDPKDVIGELRGFIARMIKACTDNRARREEEERKAAQARKQEMAKRKPTNSMVDDLLLQLRKDVGGVSDAVSSGDKSGWPAASSTYRKEAATSSRRRQRPSLLLAGAQTSIVSNNMESVLEIGNSFRKAEPRDESAKVLVASSNNNNAPSSAAIGSASAIAASENGTAVTYQNSNTTSVPLSQSRPHRTPSLMIKGSTQKSGVTNTISLSEDDALSGGPISQRDHQSIPSMRNGSSTTHYSPTKPSSTIVTSQGSATEQSIASNQETLLKSAPNATPSNMEVKPRALIDTSQGSLNRGNKNSNAYKSQTGSTSASNSNLKHPGRLRPRPLLRRTPSTYQSEKIEEEQLKTSKGESKENNRTYMAINDKQEDMAGDQFEASKQPQLLALLKPVSKGRHWLHTLDEESEDMETSYLPGLAMRDNLRRAPAEQQQGVTDNIRHANVTQVISGSHPQHRPGKHLSFDENDNESEFLSSADVPGLVEEYV